MPTLENKEKEEGKKDACWLPELGCLATYVTVPSEAEVHDLVGS